MYAVALTPKSSNRKVGPIPVSTTTKSTCPPACPLLNNGCYAGGGPIAIFWNALSKATAGETFALPNGKAQSYDWASFTAQIAALPRNQLWRHNQAGDLPGHDNKIDTRALKALAQANIGKRGFTYTHYPMTATNAIAIKNANAAGFTINLSANNLAEADYLSEVDAGPVVVVLPADVQGNRKDLATPKGRKVVVCPATYLDEVSCASCQLCQRRGRKVIIGFPAHGASARKASAIATKGV